MRHEQKPHLLFARVTIFLCVVARFVVDTSPGRREGRAAHAHGNGAHSGPQGEQAEAGSFGGVTIEVRDQDGDVIPIVTTDSNGDYEVTNLPDGIYTVVVTDEDNVLNGFEHTDSPNGLSDTSDETSKDDSNRSRRWVFGLYVLELAAFEDLSR